MSAERPLKRPVWRSMALCRGMDTNTFFGLVKPSEAKEICACCEVRIDCAIEAVEIEMSGPHEVHGVWGGMGTTARHKWARENGLMP